VSTKRTPTQVLRAARQQDSHDKRTRVIATVQDMLRHGDAITFAAVARRARVSTWLVYAPGMREYVEDARRRQAQRPSRERPSPSTSSLRTDLELARQTIRELRAERDHLKETLRLHLGQQLDQVHSRDLNQRIEQLDRENRQLNSKIAHSAADNDRLTRNITELEDDLAAARTSLRRMIRAGNAPLPTAPSDG
jgi:chromosome segregation ATPase